MRSLVLTAALLLAACETETIGKSKVSFSVKSAVAGVQAEAPLPATAPAFGRAALEPNQIAGVSFTPDSLFVPITRITLSGKKYEIQNGEKVEILGQTDVYTCPGSAPADCLVEISNPAALEALSAKLAGLSIDEGVYDTISVYNGFGEGETFVKGSLRAKGSFSLQGVTYYTSANGPVTDAAAADYIEIEAYKGDWSFPVQANGALTLTPDDAVTVSLFANYDALLYGLQVSSLASDANGCPTALEISICGTEPAIVGFVGETAPSVEPYTLEFAGSGWYDNMTGLFVVVLGGDGSVIGVMPKQYYDGRVGGKTGNFFGVFESFTVNADGSIDLTKGEPQGTGYVRIDGFQRADHEGAVEIEAQGAGTYTAKRP